MPSPLPLTVSPLDASAGERYNSFLLQGIERHPDTLRIAASDIAAQPFVTLPSPNGATFVAQTSAGLWCGTVCVQRETERAKRQHIAWVMRMYVPVEFSGSGVGRLLLVHAVHFARTLPGVSKLNLTVAAHNTRAVKLYTQHGFVEFAREADAFRDTEPRTELSLSLTL